MNKKAYRIVGGVLTLAALIGMIIFSCSAFEYGTVSYGQALARILIWALVGLTGVALFDYGE